MRTRGGAEEGRTGGHTMGTLRVATRVHSVWLHSCRIDRSRREALRWQLARPKGVRHEAKAFSKANSNACPLTRRRTDCCSSCTPRIPMATFQWRDGRGAFVRGFRAVDEDWLKIVVATAAWALGVFSATLERRLARRQRALRGSAGTGSAALEPSRVLTCVCAGQHALEQVPRCRL